MKKIMNELKCFIEFCREVSGNCFWLYKYNYQGFKFWWKYREIGKLIDDENMHEDSKIIEEATEAFNAAQFACEYGKQGDKEFREFVDDIESKGIASRRELRMLIEGKDLNKYEDRIVIRKPHPLLAIMGYLILPFYILAAFAYSVLIILSGGTLLEILSMLILFNLVFISTGYCTYLYSIAPGKIVNKLEANIKAFIHDWYRVKQGRLTIVS